MGGIPLKTVRPFGISQMPDPLCSQSLHTCKVFPGSSYIISGQKSAFLLYRLVIFYLVQVKK